MQPNYELALHNFSKVIELAGDAINYSNRASAYRRLGDLNKALEDANHAIQLDRNIVYGYLTRANIYCDIGNNEAALADVQHAVTLDTSAWLFVYRGNVYRAMGNYEAALADFAKVNFQTLEDPGLFFRDRALLHCLAGDPHSAVADATTTELALIYCLACMWSVWRTVTRA